ncbi:MAG: aspartate aminotransferase family protein [Opitutaceae bacterium]|nr:aspartate aminotransferase family protein [Opitutaceae bacterium]
MAIYSLNPVVVPPVKTRYRTIKTKLPVPQSLPLFKALAKAEPRSMLGQPPIIWDKADDFSVSDRWGNRWIDWSSGVLITNVGHGADEVKRAVIKKVKQGLLATYVFVHEDRAALCRELQSISPDPRKYHVFLLSTGSEAVENCIKLSKTYAMEKHGPQKRYLVSFTNGFHGRTMGSQLAGGMPKLKKWLGESDRTFVQVPFPDGFKNADTSFDLFLRSLQEQGVKPEEIAGVLSEAYQGVGPDFFPVDYARKLEAFCREHDIVLTMDEVQSGFGRTGKWFTYEQYGIKPDLIACGKGITSSLPLSAVIGREDILGLYAPGSMTSTHSASPLCVAAALANMKLLKKGPYIRNAARLGRILVPELHRIQKKYPDVLGAATGMGLVGGIQVVKRGTKEPDAETATAINVKCFHKGLLMFAPVGIGGECIKIAPPLSINEAALREGLQVLEEAIDEVLG